MAHWPNHLPKQEGEVMNRLLTAAFENGFEVEVEYGYGDGDEDDTPVTFTTDRAAIQRESAATGITLWHLRKVGEDKRTGTLVLVHGNCPWEVLCDMSAPDNATLDALGAIFDPVIDRCEELYA